MNRPEESMNVDTTITNSNSQNCSFGLTGVTFENSFGFKMDLENFQCAKANIEVRSAVTAVNNRYPN